MALPAPAQDGIPPTALQLIDSALSIMDMNRGDCAMRWDMVTMDSYRLPVVKEVFEQPFKTFQYTRYHATHLRELDADNADIYFQRLLRDMQLGSYKPVVFSGDRSNEEIQSQLKMKKGAPGAPTLLDRFTFLPLFKQYILPLIETVNAVNKARSGAVREKILTNMCDTLNMIAADEEKADIYETKEAEIKADTSVREFFDKAALVDMPQLYTYSLSLYRHYLAVLKGAANAQEILRDSIQTTVIETIYGRIVFGGPGDDVYSGDYLFILDVGGNDTYILHSTKADAIAHPVRVILDLSGNDNYIGSSYTLGSGMFGCGILIDADGNDSYKAASFSLGAGVFGVGILHDMNGTDSYQGAVFSQGAGFFGIGMLIDDSGNDSYSVQAYGQAIGRTKGFGALCDKGGNDVYTTQSSFVDDLRYDAHYISFTQGVGYGYRPIASGGIGVLYDARGNDTYISDIFGQGTAYWFGIGALIDDEGEDRYQSYQYAQGSGIHFAHAILWDRKGDDVYTSHGVSQGCGHDVGFGMLLDEKGDDSYIAESLSLGGGNANAVSIFCDERGDDSYIARNTSNTMGFSDFRRNYGMIGIFADGGGTDSYGETLRNNSASTKSFYGVFLDRFNDSKEAQAQEEKKPDPAFVSGGSLDRLFIQASAAAVRHQYMVNPARAEIVKYGKDALAFIGSQLRNEGARERQALEDLIPKLYQKDSADVRKMILDSLASPNYLTLSMSLVAVGKCKIAQAAPQMQKLLHHEDWRIRANVAQQAGEAKIPEIARLCAQLLSDTVPNVRARAAYTIGQVLPDESFSLLKNALEDKTQVVRNSAAMGLKSNAPLKAKVYERIITENTSLSALRSLARIIASVDSAGCDSTTLLQRLPQMDASVRAVLYRSIVESKNSYWKKVLEQWLQREKDASLLTIVSGINAIPEKPIQATPSPSPKSKPKSRKSVAPSTDNKKK